MPSFNDYDKYGRTLLVRFTCYRCGKIHIEELEPLDEKAGDHYGHLTRLPIPKGWSDWLWPRFLLCNDCTTKLSEFMNAYKKEEKP